MPVRLDELFKTQNAAPATTPAPSAPVTPPTSRQDIAIGLARDAQFKQLTPDRQQAVFNAAVQQAGLSGMPQASVSMPYAGQSMSAVTTTDRVNQATQPIDLIKLLGPRAPTSRDQAVAQFIGNLPLGLGPLGLGARLKEMPRILADVVQAGTGGLASPERLGLGGLPSVESPAGKMLDMGGQLYGAAQGVPGQAATAAGNVLTRMSPRIAQSVAVGGGVGKLDRALVRGFEGGVFGATTQFPTDVASLQKTPQQAAVGAAANVVVPPIVHGVGQAIEGTGRALYRDVQKPVFSWIRQRLAQGVDVLRKTPDQANTELLGMVDKLGQAVQSTEKQLPQEPSKDVLYPIADKLKQAYASVKTMLQEKYGEAMDKALANMSTTPIEHPFKSLEQSLQQLNLLSPSGERVPFGKRMPFTPSEDIRLRAYETLKDIYGPSKQLTGIGSVSAANYRRSIDRLDELIGMAEGNKDLTSQKLLIPIRDAITEGLGEAEQSLGKVIPEYATFKQAEARLQPYLRNPDSTVNLLQRAGKETQRDLASTLNYFDTLSPPEAKFNSTLQRYHQDVADYHDLKKAPSVVRNLLRNLGSTEVHHASLVKSLFDPNLPAPVQRSLELLDKKVPFLDSAKDLAAYYSFRGNNAAALHEVLGISATGQPRASLFSGVGLNTPAGAELYRNLLPAINVASAVGRGVTQAVGGTAASANILPLFVKKMLGQ